MSTPPYLSPALDERSIALRRLVVRQIEGGRRGHVGSAFSLIEMLRVLYDDVLRYDPKNPEWEQRDRFIFSIGHGCLALYAILADKGFFPMSHLATFCRAGSILGGHPEAGKVPGVEASTGALGHGLPIGIGKAIALRMNKAPQRVFVILSDGECNEGSTWEAALHAAKHKLSNLKVLLDCNKQQSYGATREVLDLEPLGDKWRAFNFMVQEVDGHDVGALRCAIKTATAEDTAPSVIICHTVKGKGIPFIEGDPSWHHKSKVSEEEVAALYRALEG